MIRRICSFVTAIAVFSGCGAPLKPNHVVASAPGTLGDADCADPKQHVRWPMTSVDYRRTLSAAAANVEWEFFQCGTAITTRMGVGDTLWPDYSDTCSRFREWLCFKQSNRSPDNQGLFVAMPKGYRSGTATWVVDGVEFKAEPLGAASRDSQVVRIVARRVSGSEHPPWQSFIYTFESGILEAIVETGDSEGKQIYVLSQKFGIFAQGSEY